MTQLATRTHAALMHIIRLVTDIAFTRRHFVCRCEVAFFAGRHGMQTEKWKAGHIMFEAHLPAPAIFIMALLTALPFLSPVNIIRPMTTETFRCKLFLVDLTPMTG